jgi:hypothetical protein
MAVQSHRFRSGLWIGGTLVPLVLSIGGLAFVLVTLLDPNNPVHRTRDYGPHHLEAEQVSASYRAPAELWRGASEEERRVVLARGGLDHCEQLSSQRRAVLRHHLGEGHSAVPRVEHRGLGIVHVREGQSDGVVRAGGELDRGVSRFGGM